MGKVADLFDVVSGALVFERELNSEERLALIERVATEWHELYAPTVDTPSVSAICCDRSGYRLRKARDDSLMSYLPIEIVGDVVWDCERMMRRRDERYEEYRFDMKMLKLRLADALGVNIEVDLLDHIRRTEAMENSEKFHG